VYRLTSIRPSAACALVVTAAALAAAPAADAATAKIACVQRGVTGAIAKPKVCAVVDRGKAASTGADLHGLRWKNWGKKTATATGVDEAFRSDGTGYSVKVTVSGLKKGRYSTVVVDYGDGVKTTYKPR
jgi:hypothetical protein